MQIEQPSSTSRLTETAQSTALEKTARSRAGQFSQTLKQVESSIPNNTLPPAPATLHRLALPRHSLFMQNMSLDQRRSAVDERGFSARPAAMERVSAPVVGQAGRSREVHSSSYPSSKQVPGRTEGLTSPSRFDIERSNGKAQKRQMLEEANNTPKNVKNIIDNLLKNTLTFELLDITDYPVIRYAATGEPRTHESRGYYSTTLTSILKQREHLYETEKQRGIADVEILEKLLNFNDNLPHRFRKMANW